MFCGEETPNKTIFMRIAVIADTHGKLPVSALPELQTADEIWHLGDYCDAATLHAAQTIGPPFHGVLGNNDYGLQLPRALMLERAGRKFFLIHIPPPHIEGADFLLHGHTHVPRDEKIGATRILNPGTIGKPNKGAPPSWGWLTIHSTGRVNWTLVPVRQPVR